VEQKKEETGKPSKLSIEDQVLMSLSIGEYRTYFHIGRSWDLHEATVCRIVKKVENALIRWDISATWEKAFLTQNP